MSDPHALLKAQARRRIDEYAGSIRTIFITDVPGQQAVYMSKFEQATAYVAAGYSGPVPSYIAAEAETTGQTPAAVADWIIATANQWNNVIGPTIESVRLQGKRLISNATSPAEISVIEAGVIDQLNQIAA